MAGCGRDNFAHANQNNNKMAKVKPMALIESMTGKICQDSDIHFVRRNGKVFTAKLCKPHTGPKTEAQLATAARFKAASEQVAAIMANKSGAEYKDLEAAFKNQDKYSTLRGYLFARIWKEL